MLNLDVKPSVENEKIQIKIITRHNKPNWFVFTKLGILKFIEKRGLLSPLLIFLTWAAHLRLKPSSYGFGGVFYSANSNMSSPSVVEKYRGGGANLNESYRTVTDSHYMFQSWSRSCVDESISNTSVRYYNVGGYATGGGMEHGDNGVTCTLIAQEIAS